MDNAMNIFDRIKYWWKFHRQFRRCEWCKKWERMPGESLCEECYLKSK